MNALESLPYKILRLLEYEQPHEPVSARWIAEGLFRAPIDWQQTSRISRACRNLTRFGLMNKTLLAPHRFGYSLRILHARAAYLDYQEDYRSRRYEQCSKLGGGWKTAPDGRRYREGDSA